MSAPPTAHPRLPDALLRLLAGRHLARVGESAVVRWASETAAAGASSPALRALAALPDPEPDSEEVDALLDRALAEMGLVRPGRRQTLELFARTLARDVTDGRLDPVEGCREIYRVSFHLNHPELLRAFIYLDDMLDLAEHGDVEVDEVVPDILRASQALSG